MAKQSEEKKKSVRGGIEMSTSAEAGRADTGHEAGQKIGVRGDAIDRGPAKGQERRIEEVIDADIGLGITNTGRETIGMIVAETAIRTNARRSVRGIDTESDGVGHRTRDQRGGGIEVFSII
jgi:hypothetical protein